jgi:hypothetical protein
MTDVVQLRERSQAIFDKEMSSVYVTEENKLEMQIWLGRMDRPITAREAMLYFLESPANKLPYEGNPYKITPNIHVLPESNVTWGSISPETSTCLEKLHIAKLNELGVQSWANAVQNYPLSTFLRNDEFGLAMRKFMAQEIIEPHIVTIRESLNNIFQNVQREGIDPQMPDSGRHRQYTVPDSVRAFLMANNESMEHLESRVMDALRAHPEAKAAILSLVSFADNELRSLLLTNGPDGGPDPEIEGKLINGFIGLTMIGALTYAMSQSGHDNNDWELQVMGYVMQKAAGSEGIRSGALGIFLRETPEWQAFMQGVPGA